MKIVYYNYEQLKEFLYYHEDDSKIFLPNEIFDDLKDNIDITKSKRGSEHIAYAYSYVYLITYLYRYARYEKHLYKEGELKEILQTPQKNNHKSYITMEGGILDQLKYIEKENDYPIMVYYKEFGIEGILSGIKYGDKVSPMFHMNSDLIETFCEENGECILPSNIAETVLKKNHKINCPFRAFQAPTRYVDSKGKRIKEKIPTQFDENGYFFDIENTHMIPVEVFMFCMSKGDLGTLGFYIYSFLKHKNDIFPNGWDCPKEQLVQLTGIKSTILNKTLKALEEYNMIYNSHEPYYFNLHLSNDIIPMACTYIAKSFDQFKEEKQQVDTREIIVIENDEYEDYSVITEHEVDSLFN